MEEIKLSKKEAYEAMIHFLYQYFKETGSGDLTDILSGGEYKENCDEPMDLKFKYMWEEITEKVKKGKEPKRKNWRT